MTTSLEVQLMEHSKVLGQVYTALHNTYKCWSHACQASPLSCQPLLETLSPHSTCKHGSGNWEPTHANQALLSYILRGIRDGVRSGFHQSHSCKTAKCYMQSAYQHPLPVEENFSSGVCSRPSCGPLPIQTFHTQRLALLELSQNAISWEGGS